MLSQPCDKASVQTIQISALFSFMLTNYSFILTLLNTDNIPFIFFSCQNHDLPYKVFHRKHSAKLKDYKVIMQTKKKNLSGKRQR